MKPFLLFILMFTIKLNAQYQVGHMSINFKDASRTGGYLISGGIQISGTGRDIGTEVYYPSNAAGNNTAVANGSFPIVVFGHGFVMTYDNYDNIYNALAAKGFIVMLPRTEGSFSPTHADFGADLKYLANAGMSLNTTATPTALATFNNKVKQKAAIGGHSMGAGSSFLAVAANASVTCLFNMCAATTNPSSILSASLVTVPTLMLSGEMDSVADTTVQNSHYTAMPSTKKFHVIIKGAKHCDFGNGTSTFCTIGQPACSGTNCNTILFNRYMAYLEPFLANQLKDDCNEGVRFMDSVLTLSSSKVGRKITGTIANPATVFIAPSYSVCSGNSITLSATGANTYTWTGGITNGLAFTPTTPQNYTVTAGNTFGCTKTATTAIMLYNNPTLQISSTSTLLCSGFSATLTASGANTYTWAAGPTSSTYTINPSTTTVYTVTGMDSNGCYSTYNFTQNVSVCTAINTLHNNFDISVYPNPTTDIITINYSSVLQNIQIKLMDVTGKLVYQNNEDITTANYSKDILISQLSKGMYVLTVSGKGVERVFKIIKQ